MKMSRQNCCQLGITQAVLSNELSRAMEPVRRLPATLAAALPVTDVTALQQRGSPAMGPPSGYALPPGPSPQACSVF